MAVHIRRRECIVTLGSAAAVWPLAKRAFTVGTAAFTFAPASLAKAVERPARHGISAFGDLKYAPDFKQFDYVNPNAPKGGVFSYVSPTRIFNQNCSRSIPSTVTFSRVIPPRAWSAPSRA